MTAEPRIVIEGAELGRAAEILRAILIARPWRPANPYRVIFVTPVWQIAHVHPEQKAKRLIEEVMAKAARAFGPPTRAMRRRARRRDL